MLMEGLAERGKRSLTFALKLSLAALGVATCLLTLLLLFPQDDTSTSRTDLAVVQSVSDDASSQSISTSSKPYSSVLMSSEGERYQQSLFKNHPERVQESLITAITRGGIDEWVQLDAYFFTHRYIDNGGNIYELYDFIEGSPEVAFLKEAESIYPEVFAGIRDRRAPFTYSDQGMYAYLAYLEVLEKRGYANAATLSTLANQYAKLAYYKKGIREEKSEGLLPTYPDYSLAEIASDLKKGQSFYVKAEEALRVLMSAPEPVDATVLDAIYAGEQLGSASRYFSGYGNAFESETSAAEAFAFAARSAYRSAPEFYLYVSLSNASTALLVESTSELEIRNAVYPFLDIRGGNIKKSGIVEKVIRARIEPEGARFRDLDLYSRKNIIELGRRVPEFKAWLMSNGWKEEDFDKNGG